MESVIKCRTITTQGLHAELFFTWRIANFLEITRGVHWMESPTFSSNLSINDRWLLYCYHRPTLEDDDYIGVRLRLLSSNEDQIMAQYNLSVTNETGRAGNIIHSRVCQFKEGEFRGVAKFIKRSEILDRNTVIFCRIKMFIDEHLQHRILSIRGGRQRPRPHMHGVGAREGKRLRNLARLKREMENGTFDMSLVNIQNAGGFLRLVIDAPCTDVRRRIFHFIKTHYEEFMRTNGYRRIKECYPEIYKSFLREIAEEENIL